MTARRRSKPHFSFSLNTQTFFCCCFFCCRPSDHSAVLMSGSRLWKESSRCIPREEWTVPVEVQELCHRPPGCGGDPLPPDYIRLHPQPHQMSPPFLVAISGKPEARTQIKCNLDSPEFRLGDFKIVSQVKLAWVWRRRCSSRATKTKLRKG